MAITDSTAELTKGAAKTAVQALDAAPAQAAPPVRAPDSLPPSVQEAQFRSAARAREATVQRWLRRLSSTA